MALAGAWAFLLYLGRYCLLLLALAVFLSVFLVLNCSCTLLVALFRSWALLLALARSCLLFVDRPRFESLSQAFGRLSALVCVFQRMQVIINQLTIAGQPGRARTAGIGLWAL